jgi:hypothetical protein
MAKITLVIPFYGSFRDGCQPIYQTVDVYSYNFSDDKKLLKLLGMQNRSLTPYALTVPL